jgi:hypothetical protein
LQSGGAQSSPVTLSSSVGPATVLLYLGGYSSAPLSSASRSRSATAATSACRSRRLTSPGRTGDQPVRSTW